MKIEVRLDRKKIDHTNPGDVRLMVSVTAPEIEEAKRKPIDAVLVIDVSTSMTEAAADRPDSPTKLALAKDAAARFVDNLTGRDRVGLVIYSDGAIVLAPVAELTPVHRRMLGEHIARLAVIGGTNLVEGTLRGLGCMAELPPNDDRVRRVMLLTDGLPTVGVAGYANVLKAIQARLDGKTPITTIGFGATVGSGYDPELLTAIAKASGGNFYHAEGMDGILNAFALELGALRSVAATNVLVAIVPGADIDVKGVYNDLPTSVKDGATIVELGSLYGGETQCVVVKLVPPKRDKAFPRDTLAAKVVVSGVSTVSGAFQKEERVEFRYVDANEADTQRDPAVEEQRLRLKAARAVKRAYEEAQAGHHQEAAARIRVIRLALAQFGSPDSQVLVVALEAIELDIGDPRRFAARAGEIHATSASMGTRHTTTMGGVYLKDETYMTPAQRQSQEDMGTKGSSAS